MSKENVISRKEQAAKTRKKIFEATVNLFEKKKFNSIAITDICKEAGVSVGNFYNYFDNKEAILDEAFENFSRNFMVKYCEFTKDKDLTPIENIYFVCDYYSEISVKRGKSFMTIIMNHELEKQEDYLNNPERSTYSFLQESVKQACEQNYLCAHDPTEVYISIFRVLRGTVYESILRTDDLNLKDEIRHEVEKIIKYYSCKV